MADMLTTNQAKIHIECQFHLKRGEFLLTEALEMADYIDMSFTSLDGNATSETQVQNESLDDVMWSLTQCNFPETHV